MDGKQFLANKYQEVDVGTATPLHLVSMLYDAAICSLEEARGCMERKDISGRSRAINKCNAIIAELQSSLNMKEGGDIASSLNRLYDYMKSTLLRASVEQNTALIVEVSGLLENLRSAWRQIDSEAALSAMASAKLESLKNAGMKEESNTAERGGMNSFSISA
jgi:flagellar protein FliS